MDNALALRRLPRGGLLKGKKAEIGMRLGRRDFTN